MKKRNSISIDGRTKSAINPWLVTDLSAIYLRDDGRSSFLAANQCTAAHLCQ